MNFVEELKWRGMLHDSTPGAEEALARGMNTGYIGFDPTARSLTIGNYVQLMVLTLWQQSGHQPIYLAGGATGRIGDPSGKDKERQLKSYEELDQNLVRQQQQARKFLNFDDGENKALMINNYDFYKSMNILDFLRDVGKNLTVNYMLSKDSVKNRLQSGLSFTEFSYQLLQAYDFLCLYRQYNCTFQMGGSDQWGNITSGTEFIRRNIPGSKAYALTAPLLTKADGKKFGKSEEGNIWLDPEMTSPYKFYQFWINADDADLTKYLKTFSLKSHEAIEALIAEEDPRIAKKELAAEMTIRIHSHEAYASVLDVSQILFNKKATADQLRSLSQETLSAISREIPNPQLLGDLIAGGISVVDLLTEGTHICSSKSEARRALKNNAISINKVKISDPDTLINIDDALYGKYLMIDNGKKNKYLVSMIES